MSREEDSWLSKAQHAALRRADEADPLGSPVPTRVVSNGEYFPMPQTLQQKQVEARIAELAGETARRLGMSRRRFLASSAGMPSCDAIRSMPLPPTANTLLELVPQMS